MRYVAVFLLLVSLDLDGQSLADLFETCRESVVVVGTLQQVQLGGGPQNVVSEAGLGSGVLISEDGQIWTAAHVVQVAEKLVVKFYDGTIHDARVLASSTSTDLALLQVVGNPPAQPAAQVGDSDKVRTGDDIFIIGAPKGLEWSLSRGVVSGKYKGNAPGFGGPDAEFIQVDAAINPGNSGGPVFNMAGEVVGIASFILTESGGFEGIGFAATSNSAHAELTSNRIYSGISGIMLHGEMSKALNVPGQGGFLVTQVSSKGLGAQVGLQPGTIKAEIEGMELLLGGDIILEIAGVALYDDATEAEVRKKMKAMPQGSEVDLKLLRDGEILTRRFTILE